MKWVIIKGVRYPMSVVSAFAAYYGNNPFLKIRIRSKYHIIYFDNFDCLNIQEAGDVVGAQGAGRGRIGLGYILPPIFWIGEWSSN